MKADIHPDYHEVTVIRPDGSEFTTRSTMGKAGDQIKLDIDPSSHPAWTGGSQRLNETDTQLARFKKKYGSFGI